MEIRTEFTEEEKLQMFVLGETIRKYGQLCIGNGVSTSENYPPTDYWDKYWDAMRAFMGLVFIKPIEMKSNAECTAAIKANARGSV